MKVHPVSFHVSLSFAAPVCELFNRWLHEMNPQGLGNIPFHAPIHYCNAWAASFVAKHFLFHTSHTDTLHSGSGFIHNINILWVLQWIKLKMNKQSFKSLQVQFSDILVGPRLTGWREHFHTGLWSTMDWIHQPLSITNCQDPSAAILSTQTEAIWGGLGIHCWCLFDP